MSGNTAELSRPKGWDLRQGQHPQVVRYLLPGGTWVIKVGNIRAPEMAGASSIWTLTYPPIGQAASKFREGSHSPRL